MLFVNLAALGWLCAEGGFVIAASRCSCALVLACIASTCTAGETELYEGECGQTVFQVEVDKGEHPLDRKFKLSTVGTANDKMLYVTDEGGWFQIACLNTAKKKPLLVFQASCGGSGCVEGKYGAIDPGTQKVLLRPSTGNVENHKALSRLLGYEAPYLVNHKDAFCCSSE